MNKVKFSAFGDLHHDEHWVGDTQERLDFILERAKKESVDFVIHLGDFCHDPLKVKDTIDKYNNFELPTYHVLGNHDTNFSSLAQTMECFNMASDYYYFDKNGFRFIVLNTNFLRHEGKDISLEKMNHHQYRPYKNCLSASQLEWLEEVVMSSPYPMVLFSHHTLSVDKGGLSNKEDLQNIIRKAHKNKKRILMCINGHHHMDHMKIHEHVCYLYLNSPTMCYLAEEHHLFPEEFHQAHPGARHCVIYNDPVHAIMTLSEDGTIEIDGMKSSFFHGISKASFTDNEYDDWGMLVTPDVMTEKIILPMEL